MTRVVSDRDEPGGSTLPHSDTSDLLSLRRGHATVADQYRKLHSAQRYLEFIDSRPICQLFDSDLTFRTYVSQEKLGAVRSLMNTSPVKRIRGEPIQFGPFSLGKFGLAINLYASKEELRPE
jgi:hypothetical protein